MFRRAPTLLFAIILLHSVASSTAAVLVEYGFAADLSPSTAAAGVAATNISESGFFTLFSPGDTTSPGNSSPHLRAAGFGNTPTPAITWSLQPVDSGAYLDFTDGAFSFDYHITPSGITRADLQFRINDGSFAKLETITVSRVSSWQSASTSLGSLGSLAPGDTIDFRFTNGSGSNGSALNLDTFRITGDLVPIPEPAHTGILLSCLCGLVLARRLGRSQYRGTRHR